MNLKNCFCYLVAFGLIVKHWRLYSRVLTQLNNFKVSFNLMRCEIRNFFQINEFILKRPMD